MESFLPRDGAMLSVCLSEAHVCFVTKPNSTRKSNHSSFLFTARAYARAVLGVVILSICPSVCLYVRLSHACIVTKLNNVLQIFLYHTTGQSLCYSDTNSGWCVMLPSV